MANVPEARGLHAGGFLVSTDNIRSGIFHRSVVLMVEHSRWGAWGFIVNKPSSGSLQRRKHWSIRMLAAEEEESLPVSARGWEGAGGPVLQDSFVAHLCNSSEAPCSQAQEVLEGVWWSEESLEQPQLVGGPPQRYLRLHGYAGWAPRQLEMEIARHAWTIVNASQGLVFAEDTTDLWRRLAEMASLQDSESVS